MSSIDLGFLEKCVTWKLESYNFPSKVGGKPAWLSLENIPKQLDLECKQCGAPLIFLLQIYAPHEEDSTNFHRTLFLFICRDEKCCQRNSNQNLKVFRSTLKRQNKFYDFDPPQGENTEFSLDKWLKLCNLCGCSGEKYCSKCHQAIYCSKQHQVIDWKEGHKHECEKTKIIRKSKQLFDEWEIIIDAEELLEDNQDIDESKEIQLAEQWNSKSGLAELVTDSELQKYSSVDEDKTFSKFQKRIEEDPDQILRYHRGGEPLWIASQPKPIDIPNCEYCGSPRQFEFQVMPQLLSLIKEQILDWGIMAVYTCKASCEADTCYKEEYVFKQDVKT